MKRFVLLAVSLVLLMSCFSPCAFADSESGDGQYSTEMSITAARLLAEER